MSGTGPVDGADRGELLSALLDGELTPTEEAEVRAWLDADPEARSELEALTAVRSAVRGLPPVDPPFGFYERMLRDGAGPTGRRDPAPRRWRGGGMVAAAAAVLVALVLVVGVTPPAEAMVPPVDRYAARHEAMTMGATGAASKGSAPANPGSGAPSTTASTAPAPTTTEAGLAAGTLVGTTATGGPGTTRPSSTTAGSGTVPSSVAPGTTARPPSTGPVGSTTPSTARPSTTTTVVSTGGAATSGGYEPIDPAALADEAMAPAALLPEATRAAAYRGPGGVLHVVYVEAGTPVSLYEEPGMVEWGRLPDAGKRVDIGGHPGWWMRAGSSEVLVVEKSGMVFTLVGSTSHEDMIELGDALPAPSEPSWTGRLQRAAEDCSRRFGFGG